MPRSPSGPSATDRDLVAAKGDELCSHWGTYFQRHRRHHHGRPCAPHAAATAPQRGSTTLRSGGSTSSRTHRRGRRAEIDAEYERQLAGGPDFTAYHVGSAFVEPPLHQITREDRVRALQAFDAVRAGLYRHCRAPRAQAVSQNYRHVYGVLLSYAVKRGRVYPCLETIAMAAMVSRSTVLRAIAWLKLFGFLDRIRRLKREQTPLGSVRVCQTSNAYRLTTTLTGLSALALGVFRGAPSATTRLHQPTQRLSNEEKAGSVTQFQFQSP